MCEFELFEFFLGNAQEAAQSGDQGVLPCIGGMMTLAELGEILREERVRRGYSVEDVATTVKITSRVVRAIEEGDESSLPHAVYACGFIKAYAAFVGLEDSDVRPALDALTKPQEDNQPIKLAPPPRSSDRRAGGGLLPVLVIGAALAFGLFWFRAPLADTLNSLTSFVQEQNQPSRATPTEAPLPEEVDLNSAQEANPSAAGTGVTSGASGAGAADKSTSMVPPAQAGAVAKPVGQSNATHGAAAPFVSTEASSTQAGLSADGLPSNLDPATINAMSGTPADSDRPNSEARAVGSSFGEQVPAPVTDTTLTLHTDATKQTDVTRAGQGKHQIVISAVEECWVHSSADGTFTRQFSLKKGETFALSFENKLVIKLGNAGGVRIKYDGEEMPEPGKSGQVRTITFPPTPESR